MSSPASSSSTNPQCSADAAAAGAGIAAPLCPKLAAIVAYLNSLTARADLDVLSRLLTELSLTRDDIQHNCIFGAKGYKRNTIARSDWFELLALCWHSGDRTPIHDHQGVSCAFKVIQGTGTEVRFRSTPSGLICPVQATQMQPGYLCAANDADIHQVANFQAPGMDLVTLHIYSPPIKSMNTYEFSSGVPAECADSYKKS